MGIGQYLRDRRTLVEAELDHLLPRESEAPKTLHAAMRHSVFAGGKRIRPILALATSEACGRMAGNVAAASALECLHTYSLIHDDLPALDDDDLRRGKPTCHKAYGEAAAILAGDALLTRSFQILAELDEPSDVRVALVAELASAAGTVDGMIGGQVADLLAEGREPGAAGIEYIHSAKTAALIRASVRFGALCAGADPTRYEALSEFGSRIGLAFQIVDDVLDVISTSEQLGKTAGKDRSQGDFPGAARHRWVQAPCCRAPRLRTGIHRRVRSSCVGLAGHCQSHRHPDELIPFVRGAGYSTSLRNSPRAGAVGPAARRSQAASTSSKSPGRRLPRPTSISVPTMFRTMRYRNPLPRTR